MLNRFYFVGITLFWVTMNVLLWRSEFGSGHEIGSAVPAEIVWQKILTAPDNSTMDVFHRGQRIGFCRWAANVGEALAGGKTSPEDYEPEGMVRRLSGYTIDFNGNVALTAITNRLRFELHLGFATNQAWRELTLRTSARPHAWEFRSTAASQSLTVRYTGDAVGWEHTFTLAELQQPQRVLEDLGLSLPFLFPALPVEPVPGRPLSLGLEWQARNDWLQIGHASVRVYRLQARLLDRFQTVVLVSRVGEILRVELPDRITLVNDALSNY
ncbi:MAG: hypothetical protein KGS61_00820 [Verrucomicrobia bacterium]|nr:hypothetical protein [Verrucomicrobiota bacterium]